MSTMHEVVHLPDPARQPHVHPLDLPAARRPLVVSWLLSVVGHPVVAISLGVILWLVSNNPVTPILAAASLMIGAHVAGRYFLAEAWSFIPRKRQALDRSLPLAWELAGSLVRAAVLGSAILLTLRWLAQPGIPDGVLAFTAGAGIAVSLLVLGGVIWRLIRPEPGSATLRSRLIDLPAEAVVIATTVYAVSLVRDGQVAGDWMVPGLTLGAATIFGAQLLYWGYDRWSRSRQAAAGTDAPEADNTPLHPEAR
jgi:hypothetical protein